MPRLEARPDLPASRTFRFADAVSCEVRFTRVWGRGYSGTNLRVKWRDARSRVVFDLDTAFEEYRIDRDEIDMDRLDSWPPHEFARFAIEAEREFRRYQRWEGEQLAEGDGGQEA